MPYFLPCMHQPPLMNSSWPFATKALHWACFAGVVASHQRAKKPISTYLAVHPTIKNDEEKDHSEADSHELAIRVLLKLTDHSIDHVVYLVGEILVNSYLWQEESGDNKSSFSVIAGTDKPATQCHHGCGGQDGR